LSEDISNDEVFEGEVIKIHCPRCGGGGHKISDLFRGKWKYSRGIGTMESVTTSMRDFVMSGGALDGWEHLDQRCVNANC